MRIEGDKPEGGKVGGGSECKAVGTVCTYTQVCVRVAHINFIGIFNSLTLGKHPPKSIINLLLC